MKSWIKGAILALFALLALIVSSIFIYLSLFSEEKALKDRNNTLLEKKVVDKEAPKKEEQNSSYEETTILEVKPSKYILASEIEDYKQAKKQKFQEENVSSYQPICKSVTTKKIAKKVFKDGIKRVAIIMDDIGNIRQVKNLLALNMPITPSIFPSTKRHPDTPKFAKKFKSYMVHVPMEAFHFGRPEENTLKTSDSLKLIDKRVASIHKDFPNAVAINNHTGSKFTSNIKAMDRLFCALDKYGIAFIDSKTAPHTYGKKMQKIHHCYVYCRDVFLDNKPDVNYILKQIELVVKKAKKRGVAIAICHPRKATFEALKRAKPLFEGVELVYIEQLYR
jgi:polysaccharide deacetylase 2 family uncharacterized protein YibQ